MKKSLQLFTVSQPLNVIKLKSRVKTSVHPGKEAGFPIVGSQTSSFLFISWMERTFRFPRAKQPPVRSERVRGGAQLGPRRVMKNKRSLNLPFLVIPGTCLGIFGRFSACGCSRHSGARPPWSRPVILIKWAEIISNPPPNPPLFHLRLL